MSTSLVKCWPWAWRVNPSKAHHHRRRLGRQLLGSGFQESHEDRDQQDVVLQGGIERGAISSNFFLQDPLQRLPE